VKHMMHIKFYLWRVFFNFLIFYEIRGYCVFFFFKKNSLCLLNEILDLKLKIEK
jgi:hypothetical protein